jgi:hypothetical protein
MANIDNEENKKILDNIQNLQDNEKKIFNSLEQSLSRGLPQDVINRQVDEINSISSIRMNLYKNLNNINSSFQKNLKNTSNVLEEQTIAIAIIENELNENKKRVSEMEQNNINKLRMIEINNYYGERYYEHTKLMKILIAIFIPILILSILANKGFIPTNIYFGLVVLIGFVGCFFLWGIILSILARDNMNYQSYNWNFNKEDAPDQEGDDEDSGESSSDPWETPVTTCKGSECCADGMYYSFEENKCVTEEGMTNINDVFTKYANIKKKPDYVMNSSINASAPYNKLHSNSLRI